MLNDNILLDDNASSREALPVLVEIFSHTALMFKLCIFKSKDLNDENFRMISEMQTTELLLTVMEFLEKMENNENMREEYFNVFLPIIIDLPKEMTRKYPNLLTRYAEMLTRAGK